MSENFSDRQLEIINASINLIGKGGIQEFTTKKLAQEIGISEAAIYRHFSGKIEILKGLLTYLKENRINRISRIEKSKKSSIEKIKQIIDEQFKTFVDRPEIVVVLLSEGMYQNEKGLSEIVFSIMQESSVIFQRILVDGQQKGEIRTDINSNQLAFLIMGSMRFCVIQWHLSDFSIKLEEQGKQLFETIFKLITTK